MARDKNRVDKGNNNSSTTKGPKANSPGIHISNKKKKNTCINVVGGGGVCVCVCTKIHKTERNTQKICRNTWSNSSKDYFQVGSRLRGGQRLQAEATDGHSNTNNNSNNRHSSSNNNDNRHSSSTATTTATTVGQNELKRATKVVLCITKMRRAEQAMKMGKGRGAGQHNFPHSWPAVVLPLFCTPPSPPSHC